MFSRNHFISTVAVPALIITGTFLVLSFVLLLKQIENTNNAYIQLVGCIISYNPSVRTNEDVDRCYATVENASGVKLQRYHP
jgi:hypothetical protein